ncbi:MAG: hypothetical protein IPK79_02085 [Vampirovibrionales bacterium]|nr:hypothetical protein [Vampirovibrionales bacterium]
MKDNETIFLHLGRLEGKVDAILSNQTLMANQLDDHDDRIGKLEHHHSWFLGASAVVASVVATAVGFFKGGH